MFLNVELISMMNWPGRIHVKSASKFNQLFSVSNLLVVVLEPLSVEELVSVEDTPTARFARYGI